MLKKSEANHELDADRTCATDNETTSVLVVDDDPGALKITRRFLRAMGYAVDTASDGAEAMQCLRRRQYDMVVTDMEMPKVDGFTLACWIKRRGENIKVVIMTGMHPAEVNSYMNTDAADGWIFKPFGMNDLRTALEAITSHHLCER